MDSALLDSPLMSVRQQPDWDDPAQVQCVRRELAGRAGLVEAGAVRTLRALLAEVAGGRAHVVQAGDCAEDPAECDRVSVARKAALLDVLAGVVKRNTHRPVIRVGRIGGQFAKPRSKPTEWVGGVELPAFRGHLVNSPQPDPVGRRPDPQRLLAGYHAASEVMHHLGWRDHRRVVVDAPVWTSHEALLLDYEIPLCRTDEQGQPLLASTHWPWVGERTRQPDGAHVALLAGVVNPVACKVGPGMDVGELLALCERLDPDREPGRLTFIVRMGAEAVADRLPPLVSAARAVGHPVIWLCDPMHGNTITTSGGRKTRVVDTLIREVREFQIAVTAAGGIPGGLHLETTPDEVTECLPQATSLDQLGADFGQGYRSFCDPRLNPQQATTVVSAWNN